MKGHHNCLTAIVSLAALACGSPEAEVAASPGSTEPQRLFADATQDAQFEFIHDNGSTERKYLPEIMGAGGSILDYDGDGLFDVYFVQSGPVPGTHGEKARSENRLFRNLGDSTFTDVTEQAGVGDTGYGMGSVAADYDADGDNDLYVVNFGDDVLLRNEGDGTFSDATGESGISNSLWGSSASFLDADRDGDLDLFVTNYVDFDLEKHIDCGSVSKGQIAYCSPDVYESAPDVFFRNNGDGTFVEATGGAGLTETSGKGLGVVAVDLTNDGWTDIYVANDATPNFLFRNRGNGTFEEAALWLGVGHNEEGKTEAGMGATVGDVDRNGWLDLLVTNLSSETNSLYLGGEEFFIYNTRAAGLYEPSYIWVGFGNDLLDLDNDGDLDLVVTNGHVIDQPELIDDAQSFRQPSQVFLNDGTGVFAEVASSLIGDLQVPRVGRGTMTLDWASDGKLDVIITFNNDRARLFRNVGESAGNWLGIRFQGDEAGARVEVESAEGAQLEEKILGSSYQTSSDPRLHFGLGEATTAATVTVRPSRGGPRSYFGLEAGRYYVLDSF